MIVHFDPVVVFNQEMPKNFQILEQDISIDMELLQFSLDGWKRYSDSGVRRVQVSMRVQHLYSPCEELEIVKIKYSEDGELEVNCKLITVRHCFEGWTDLFFEGVFRCAVYRVEEFKSDPLPSLDPTDDSMWSWDDDGWDYETPHDEEYCPDCGREL